MPRLETVPAAEAVDYEVARHVRNEAFPNGAIPWLYECVASECPMVEPDHQQASLIGSTHPHV